MGWNFNLGTLRSATCKIQSTQWQTRKTIGCTLQSSSFKADNHPTWTLKLLVSSKGFSDSYIYIVSYVILHLLYTCITIYYNVFYDDMHYKKPDMMSYSIIQTMLLMGYFFQIPAAWWPQCPRQCLWPGSCDACTNPRVRWPSQGPGSWTTAGKRRNSSTRPEENGW